MMMKTLITALLFSVAAIGTACSAVSPGEAAAAPGETAPAETASTEPEITGTLKLNIGQPRERSQDRLIGSGAFGSADFGEVPDLDIALEPGIDTATTIQLSTETDPSSDEDDDLIRIP